MIWDKNFFIHRKFSSAELERYKQSAKKSLDIANGAKDPEVAFHFAFMALIKMGICCLAKSGYRIKSRPGHHQKIIEQMSQVLTDEEILIVGDKMRKDRNLDFYGAEDTFSGEELREYLQFVNRLYQKV